jgi:ribosomal protein S18 acetylase RimI-like enzyme
MTANISIRRALAADIPRIAALHAASWRATYRGMLSDRFLDGPIEAERLAMWQRRCAGDPARWPLLFVADDPDDAAARPAQSAAAAGAQLPDREGPVRTAGALAGFVCVFPRHDPQWGTLIDNLHVAPGRTGLGIGGRLLSAAAAALIDGRCEAPVYLWVYAENHAARAIYDRLGGQPAERDIDRAVDGSDVPSIRYRWDGPAALLRPRHP